MIFAKLNSEGNYTVYPTAVRKVIDFIKKNDIMQLPLGRHEIDGDRLFLNIMEMTTHDFAGSHPEIHKEYADFFYWPEGGEKIGVSAYTGKEEIWEARPQDDISFLASVENESFLIAKEGFFAVFFPWDAHRPALMLGEEPITSRKCVFKISIELFQ